MKKILFWAIILVISISLVIVFGSAGCKSSVPPVEESVLEEVPDESEEEIKEQEQTDTANEDIERQYFIGTWINTDYDGQGRSGMVLYIQEDDGSITYSAYDNSDGSGNIYKGSVKILSERTDDEGRIYTQSKVTLEDGMAWDTLTRISADGQTPEVQPEATEIDPNNSRYSIYYLQ
ncbi:MAG: hypothetical protein U9O59_08135 [Actinomycetota bacterium]|nr:hypothetical protein [Actinomycetota bacterium]